MIVFIRIRLFAFQLNQSLWKLKQFGHGSASWHIKLRKEMKDDKIAAQRIWTV